MNIYIVYSKSFRLILQSLYNFVFLVSMLMIRNKYQDIVDTHSERLPTFNNSSFLYLSQNQGFLTSCDMYTNNMGAIFKHSFTPVAYNSDLVNLNPFCSICLKFVGRQQVNYGYFSGLFGKTYLVHSNCLNKQDTNCINTIVEDVNHARLTCIDSMHDARSFCFGEKHFYFQLAIQHPLSSKPFFVLRKKIQASGNFLVWNFKKYQELGDCFPNIVAFPYPDFEVEIGYSKISDRNDRYKHKAFVNLQKLRINGDSLVKVETDQFEMILRVITDNKNKAKTIEEMNFKYKHPLDIGLPLIEILKIQLKLPSYDSDEENQFAYSRQNSSITELLNQNSPDTSTIRSVSQYETQSKNSAYLSEMVSEKSFQKEKIDLNKLISSGKLSQYVKNNVQSRNFQSYLSQISYQQIGEVIHYLSIELSDLITHQYANYMMQKLFTYCSSQQRLLILQIIQEDFPLIVKNKQGTHTLQFFVSLFTQEKEYQLVVQRMKPYLCELSQHANGTHFIQKIINIFPLRYTIGYFYQVCSRFIDYATNKNAMCVVKQMMKKMNGKETQNIDNSMKNEIEDIKKNFIKIISLNIDKIIQDSYGNYVVQFSYEFFGAQKCFRITDMILQRFPQYSLQKYSGSVILKCVESYWTNKQTIQKIKYSLNSNFILDMFRSKQGNKILLTIMQKHQTSAVREKIYTQLIMTEPTKFLHDRWGICLGSRSGTVGTIFSSFTDAVHPSPSKKKKYYNIIQ